MMSEMLLSLLYLGANVCALGVLLSAKYYRMWALLCAQLAVTCWQVGVLLLVPVTDRTAAIHWWLPGDAVLVALTSLAVLEVLWRSMQGFPTRHRLEVCGWLTVGFVFAGMSIRWMLPMPVFADWFAQIKSDRTVWNLCIAAAALVAVGFAHTFNRTNDPRFVRFHGLLIAVLAVGHVYLADMTHWSQSRMLYRSLEAACCFGWIINANLLGREERGEFGAAARAFGSATARAVNPEAFGYQSQPERGGFGHHRAGARLALSTPSTPAGMQ